jgi:hypothetical protein
VEKIWAATKEPTRFNQIVRLCFTTGQRRGMFAALQDAWIKTDTIEFPAWVCKNRREQIIPLTALTQKLIKARSLTPYNGWGKHKAALDKASGVSGWVLHDARRVLSSGMAELKVQPHTIDRILHHTPPTLHTTYNRYEYLSEMREALEKWEALLIAIVGEKA